MVLIFDLDGTLIDSRSCIVRATREAFATSGFLEPREEEIVSAMGIPIEVTFPRWSGLEDASGLIAAYRTRYRELSSTELTVFAGIPRALEALAKEHTLAIATSKLRDVAEHNLAVCGLRSYFSCVVGSDDVSNYKPHPESIFKVLSKCPVARKVDAWMIGDATTDIEMGAAADICTCAVTWGAHSAEALSALQPASVIHCPEELIRLFDKNG